MKLIHSLECRARRERKLSIKRSFTLIELLISITIFALAGTAVYSVFASGMIAWRRGNKDKTYVRKVRIAAESMERDLKNTFDFSEIAFEGREDSVRFTALISNEFDSEGDESEIYYEVGRMAYFYDKEKGALCKEEKNFPDISRKKEDSSIDWGGEEDGKVKILFDNLRELEFSYCYLDNVTGSYKWKDDWKKEEQDSIPIAVKILMVFKKEMNQGDFEKLVFIPIGTGEQKIEIGSAVRQAETK